MAEKTLEERMAELKARLSVSRPAPPPPPEPKPEAVTAVEEAEDDESDDDPIDAVALDDKNAQPKPAQVQEAYEKRSYLVKGFGKRYECGHYITCLSMFKGGGDAHCPGDCPHFIKPEAERATDYMQGNGWFWQ